MMKGKILILAASLLCCYTVSAQGDDGLRNEADALFEQKQFAQALPMYSQLVSLYPSDHTLNYKLGTCIIYGDEDKSKAVSFLAYAIKDAGTPALAWYYYGRAQHLDYRFREAAAAYADFAQRGSKKELEEYPTAGLVDQTRNGTALLNNIKDVRVLNKVQVANTEFFRYYDLDDIGGKIVVTPEELLTSFDKKKGDRSLVYLPEKEGPIYFASYGKDGRTGKDIYKTYLKPDGTFAQPQKLAGYINTDQDEDFASIQPDGKTFFFSSKGHNSMGGYDVFRSVYDPGNDVFGPPVNMDFAVNTPHDDVLYLTDPTGGEACFASGRGSEQGLIHVYRVQTDAQPVALTMLAGSYSSKLDDRDRDAVITVEDAVSKEVIGEFSTDNTGNYVISLPRAGKYKFLVKAGPSGRTHLGVVDLPRNTATTAYRQELQLVEQNDQEKLIIKNFFDEPLTDDLMALARKEIQRIARLDVNGEAEQVVVREEELTTEEIIRQAGFIGGETQEDILALANDETAKLDRTSADRRNEAVEAYKVADQRAGVATELQADAAQHVQQAEAASGPQAEEQMRQAAIFRQRSRQANTAARASHQLAQQLEQDADRLQQQTLEETAATNKLKDALSTNNQRQATELLGALKERVDIRQRPGNSLMDVTERMRREAAKQKKEADKALADAVAMRAEEQELEQRIQRLRTEAAATKKTKVKEQLEADATRYEEQLGFLKEETETEFTKANILVRNAEIADTQTAIAEKVVDRDLTVPGDKVLTPQDKENLSSRIATNDRGIESLAIDERIETELMRTEPILFQREEFEWQLADGAAREQMLASAPTRPISSQPTETFEGPGRTITRDPGDKNATNNSTNKPNGRNGETDGSATAEEELSDDPTQSATVPLSSEQTGDGSGNTAASVPNETGAVVDPESQDPNAASENAIDIEALTEEEVAQQAVAEQAAQEAEVFLLNNKIAELKQLSEATRDKDEQAELNSRIAELEEELTATKAGDVPDAEEAVAVTTPLQVDDEQEATAILEFDPEIGNGSLIAVIDPDYAEASSEAAGADQDELNSRLTALIDDKIQEQQDAIDLGAVRLVQAQPRIARLRTLRQDMDGLPSGTTLTLTPDPDLASAVGTKPQEQPSDQNEQETPIESEPTTNAVPAVMNEVGNTERYVSISRTTNMREVLELPVQHRVPGHTDVKRDRERDIAKATELRTELEGMLLTLDTMPLDKEHTKLLKKTAKVQDDLLFHQVDMGQQSAFLVEQEKAYVADSLKALEKETDRKGFGTGEPALRMAKSYKNDARLQFEKAEKMRTEADRSQDVVARDSLYRHAYAQELIALKSLDRSITAHNYLLDEDTEKGTALTYAQIEKALFDRPVVQLADAGGNKTNSSSSTEEEPQRPDPVQEEVEPLEEEAASGATDLLTAVPGETASSTQPTTNAQPNIVVNKIDPPIDTVDPVVEVPVTNDAVEAEDDLTNAPEILSMKQQARTLREEAKKMDRRSILLADRSIEVGDSASTVKKKEQEAVRSMSTDLLKESNDLQEASLRKLSEANALDAEVESTVAQQRDQRDLQRFYAFTPEDRNVVTQKDEHLRYFVAKSSTLSQQQEANEARAQAAERSDSAAALIMQAQDVMVGDVNSDLPTSSADVDRAKKLNDKAVAYAKEADVLERKADRLESASRLKDTQAELILRDLPQNDSERLVAMEARSRRTERLASAVPNRSNSTVNDDLAITPTTNGNGTTTTTTPVTTLDEVEEPGVGSSEGTLTPDTPATTTTQQDRPTDVTQYEQTADAQTSIDQPDETRSEITEVPAESQVVPEAAEPVLEVPVATTSTSGKALLPPLMADVFNITSSKASTAIKVDAPMPGGLVYKVQVGAFRNAIPDSIFAEFTPIMAESTGSGFTRYTVGLFNGFNGADLAKGEVRGLGYSDAFVVAYLNGERITLAQARRYGGQPAVVAVASTTRPSTIKPDNERTPPNSTTSNEGSTTEDTASEDTPEFAQEDPRDRFDRIDPDSSTINYTKDPLDGTNLPVYVTAESTDVSAPTTDPVVRPDPNVRYAEVQSAEEALNTFDPARVDATYYDENAAPAKQVEVIKGLFFTVQVGVYSKPVLLDQIFNITPLNTELIAGGKIRYTTGQHRDLETARSGKVDAVGKGVIDAFITAYMNGERITVAAARDLLDRFGPEILATGN